MGTAKARVVVEHKRSFFQALTMLFDSNVHLEFRPQLSTMQEIQLYLTDALSPPQKTIYPLKNKQHSNLPDNEK